MLYISILQILFAVTLLLLAGRTYRVPNLNSLEKTGNGKEKIRLQWPAKDQQRFSVLLLIGGLANLGLGIAGTFFNEGMKIGFFFGGIAPTAAVLGISYFMTERRLTMTRK